MNTAALRVPDASDAKNSQFFLSTAGAAGATATIAEPFLFDLATDPNTTTHFSAQHPIMAKELAKQLETIKGASAKPAQATRQNAAWRYHGGFFDLANCRCDSSGNRT